MSSAAAAGSSDMATQAGAGGSEVVDSLKAQIEALQAQLAVLQAQTPLSPSGKLKKTHSRLPSSGVEVFMGDDEVAAMRAVFNSLDKSKKGVIGYEQLVEMHARLGEPVTEEEAKEVIEDMKRFGSASAEGVDWESFIAWWDKQHEPLHERVKYEAHEHIGVGVLSASTPKGVPTALLEERAKERERKRQYYAARFKFMRAKIPTPEIAAISTVEEGVNPSLEWRLRFYAPDETGKRIQISPWHEIKYKNSDGTYNLLVEIPKFTRQKFEVATGEPFNPIKQDVANGQLRSFHYGDMPVNYGCIPQTWEDPARKHPALGGAFGGDTDPIDAVDVGFRQWSCGSIIRVKVLGVFAMIDSGEADWKVVAINTEDPLAPLLNDIADMEVHMPGMLEVLHRFWKLYKAPAVINEFAFEGKPQGAAFAKEVIEETHKDWQELIEKKGSAAVVGKEGH